VSFFSLVVAECGPGQGAESAAIAGGEDAVATDHDQRKRAFHARSASAMASGSVCSRESAIR